MVNFLYTGSSEYFKEQTDPEKSLGGYCSKTIIPNRVNNLFQDISYLTSRNETIECKAIVIHNTFETDLANFSIGYSYDKEKYNIEMALVELNQNNKMEIISNSKDIPYYADFFDASIDEINDYSFNLELFEKDKKYGIWIKRQTKKNTYSCSIEESIKVPEKKFEFIIKFDE